MNIRFLSFIFCFILYGSFSSQGQGFRSVFNRDPKTFQISKEYEEVLLGMIKKDVLYLTSTEPEGRKVGSRGEQFAGRYIQKRMIENGLTGFNQNFVHPFKFISGKYFTPETRVTIAEKLVFVPEEAFPVSFSAEKSEHNFFLPNSEETYAPWVIPLFDNQSEANDPNFDWEKFAYERSLKAMERGATSVLFYDEYGLKNAPKYIQNLRFSTLGIPVVILTKKAYDKHLKDLKFISELSINIKYRDELKDGHNVIGTINNNSIFNVIIIANYDHLGFDIQNGNQKNIYRGADDNASGVAAMLALADILTKSNHNKYNYIFVASSGKENNLAGSKSFLEYLEKKNTKVAYVMNLSKIGRKDKNNTVYMNWMGSSPIWSNINKSLKTSKLNVVETNNIDEPNSEYSIFYDRHIPGISLSTGLQKQHYSYDDVPALLNYSFIKDITLYAFEFISYMNERPNPRFTEIQDQKENNKQLTSDLGIIPDYEYSGIGVSVKEILEKSTAQSIGIIAEDIILQFNEKKINEIEDYLQALQNLNKGDNVIIKVKRGPTVQDFEGKL